MPRSELSGRGLFLIIALNSKIWYITKNKRGGKSMLIDAMTALRKLMAVYNGQVTPVKPPFA